MFGKKELENKIRELEKENQNLKQSYGLSKSRELKDENEALKKEIECLNKLVEELGWNER